MDIKKKGKKKIMYGTLRILDFGKNCKSITRAVEKTKKTKLWIPFHVLRRFCLPETRNSQ